MANQYQVESSTSNINLKLKISRKNNEKPISKALQINPSSNTNNHVCRVCNMSFSSGKALGGHMSSAHVQAQAKTDLVQNKLEKPNLRIRCKFCANDFISKKALSGHMKKHPERHWRGMDPPQNDKKSKDSLIYDDSPSYLDEDEDPSEREENLYDYVGQVMDLSASLKGWGATGKRGRVESDSEPDDDQDESHVAVRQMLELVNCPFPKKAVGFTDYGSGHGPDKMVISVSDKSVEKSMSVEILDDAFEIGSKVKRIKMDESNAGSNEKQSSPTIQEKVLGSSVIQAPSSTTSRYICNSCDKSFSTLQALGEHRPSHNKPRASSSNTIDEVDLNKFGSTSKAKISIARGPSKLFDTGKDVPNKETDLVDMVTYCDKSIIENGSTQVFSSVQAASIDVKTQAPKRKVLFDLNEVSQPTIENESTQGSTFDRDFSSEQATPADVITQAPKPKVLFDLNLFPFGSQLTFENETTQGSTLDRVEQGTSAYVRTQSPKPKALFDLNLPSGGQPTFENETIRGNTFDKVVSSEQATSANVRTQAPKPEVLFDLNHFPYGSQATFGNETTQGNTIDRVSCNEQATSIDVRTQVPKPEVPFDLNEFPYGSQATFENESTQGNTFDRVSSSEQATSADVRTQAPKPEALLDLNHFPDEDEI